MEVAINRRGKKAVFDVMEGKFITPFLYDLIWLDDKYNGNDKNGRYFIISKSKPVKPGYNMREITFEAIANTEGKIKVMKNYHILRILNDGVCIGIGRSKKDNKRYLLDVNEKVKSQGFDEIDELVKDPYYHNSYGLFVGVNYQEKSLEEKPIKIKNVTLLSKDGVVPIEIFATNYLDKQSEYKEGYRYFVAPELKNKEKITNAINTFGVGIIELIPQSFFASGDNFVNLMEFVIKYENEKLNSVEDRLAKLQIFENELWYVLDTLRKYAKWWEHPFAYGGCENTEHYLFSYFAEQTFQQERFAQEILDFYKEIGAIKE